MKKYFLLFCFILLAISVWPIKKSCNYLNRIPYGTSYECVKDLLGEYSSKQVLDKRANIYRCVYVLCRYNSSMSTDPYYITFEKDKVIERGVCDKTNKEFIMIPFDVKFSESLDNLENARIWRVTYQQQKGEAQSVTEKKKNNIIEALIPSEFDIRDKVFFVNNSSLPILRAVFVNAVDHDQVLGSCNFVSPGMTVQIAEFPNNSLATWKGLPIDIKIKGYGNQLSSTNILEDKEDELDPNLFTYDFVVYLYTENHDLYISAQSDAKVKNTDVLDF